MRRGGRSKGRGAMFIAKQAADTARRAARRAEMLGRAEAMAHRAGCRTAEEQRQIPARVAAATRDVDIRLVRQLRQRQAELPELIFAAAWWRPSGASMSASAAPRRSAGGPSSSPFLGTSARGSPV